MRYNDPAMSTETNNNGAGSVSNRAALIAWMEDKGIKPEALGQVLGVGRSTVYAWRKGHPPSRKNASLLSKLSDGAVPADGWD